MADQQDPFASIVAHCRISPSQEDLLTLSKFAREDETFSDDGGKPPAVEDSGNFCKELGGSVDGAARDSGEFVAICAECEKTENLGFSGERGRCVIEVVCDGGVRDSEVSGVELGSSCVRERASSSEPLMKKPRVLGLKSSNLKSGGVSPLVHCNEKMTIGKEDNRKEMVVFRSEVKVEVVSPLRCFAPDSVNQCGEKLSSGDGNGEQVEVRGVNSGKKKLEFEEEEENGSKSGKVGDDNTEDGNVDTGGSANGDNADKSAEPMDDGIQRDSKHEGERKGKRELPRSFLGHVWGATANNGGEGAGNGMSGIGTREDGLNGKPKAGETLRHFFDVLRILAVESRYDDDNGKIDIFETAKRRGMTFPQNRFRLRNEVD